MKKIAFYVEGLTEQLFLNKLLVEVAGQKQITIKLLTFRKGEGKFRRAKLPKTRSTAEETFHQVLLYDCGGEENVKTKILEDYESLLRQGYEQIIGLLDLFPKPIENKEKFERTLKTGISRNGREVTPPLPSGADIVVVVREMETWFLSECRHFKCIATGITLHDIEGKLGFNPCEGDMREREQPAKDLHAIYQIGEKAYLKAGSRKKRSRIERTIECLDYAEVYLKLRKKLPELDDLLHIIDDFIEKEK